MDYCRDRVAADSIYAILHRECFALFPDEVFADLFTGLFTDIGRRWGTAAGHAPAGFSLPLPERDHWIPERQR